MERREALKGLAAALGGLVMIPGCLKNIEPETAVTCYYSVTPYPTDYVCSYCDHTVKDQYEGYLIFCISLIEDAVNRIKKLEYDADLDKTEFCPNCSQKNIENPELIFRIRFSEETEYHIARSNIVNEYRCLLEFLSDPDKFMEEQNEIILREKIAIIQKMTGLGDNLKIG